MLTSIYITTQRSLSKIIIYNGVDIVTSPAGVYASWPPAHQATAHPKLCTAIGTGVARSAASRYDNAAASAAADAAECGFGAPGSTTTAAAAVAAAAVASVP